MTTEGSDSGRPASGRPRATLADVAAAVGISRTTASNAYNRPDQLSKELRQRIMAAAAELGYSGPDPMARSLRTRQADAVGLIFSERLGYAFRDPAAVEFLHGVGEACTERGRSLLIIPAVPGAVHADTVLRAAVDGFVVFSIAGDDPHLAAVLSRPQPVVVVDAPRDLAGVDFVGIDDRVAFGRVAAHVLGLGHRRIGVVAVRRGEDVPARGSARPLLERLDAGADPHPVRHQRLLGLLDAVEAAGVDAAGVLVSERPGNAREEGALGAAALLDAGPGLTAIMCTSDILAFGALDELASRAVEVPARVTVTGFDDVPAASSAGLTTVRQPMERKGYAAVEALLDAAGSVVLATSLVVRTSSGPVGS